MNVKKVTSEKDVTVMVPTIKKETTVKVVIEMTEQQAIDVLTLTGSLSGAPWGTVRESTDDLHYALSAQGYKSDPSRLKSQTSPGKVLLTLV